MKLLNLDKEQKTWLKITDFENYFDIHIDDKNNYVYNLNATAQIIISDEYIKLYKCQSDIHWPLISYNLYGTTRLAWLLLKLNNVKDTDIFKINEAGSSIRYIENKYI